MAGGKVAEITPNVNDKLASKPLFVRGDHAEVGRYLARNVLSTKDEPTVFTEGGFWKYVRTEHCWSLLDDVFVRQQARSLAGTSVHSKNGNRSLKMDNSNVVGSVAAAADDLAQKEFFSHKYRQAAFQNGVYSINSRGELSFQNHSPETRCRSSFMFPYRPDLAPEKWLKFLDDLFGQDEDCGEKISVLQEFIGACVFGMATQYQRCMLLYGDGGDGKSVLIDAISMLFPPKSLASYGIHQLCNAERGEYYAAKMNGVAMNIAGEIPSSRLGDSSTFKSIVAGDVISARHPAERPFEFRPYAGHLFAGNSVPPTNDQTRGFMRRWIVLRFNRCFLQDPARRQPEAILAELRSELPAIAAWAVEGAMRLAKQSEYTKLSSSEEHAREWREDSDPVSRWMSERVRATLDEMRWTSAADLYRDYRSWSDKTGHRLLSTTLFGRMLKQAGVQKKHTMHGARYSIEVIASSPPPEHEEDDM